MRIELAKQSEIRRIARLDRHVPLERLDRCIRNGEVFVLKTDGFSENLSDQNDKRFVGGCLGTVCAATAFDRESAFPRGCQCAGFGAMAICGALGKALRTDAQRAAIYAGAEGEIQPPHSDTGGVGNV